MPTESTTDTTCPTALVYETAEEARIVLEGDRELTEAALAAGEAAYWLSDAMEPEERRDVLAVAETRPRPLPRETATEERALEAIGLIGEAEVEVSQLMRGPAASSELLIALRALRRAGELLSRRLGFFDTTRDDLGCASRSRERARRFLRPRRTG